MRRQLGRPAEASRSVTHFQRNVQRLDRSADDMIRPTAIWRSDLARPRPNSRAHLPMLGLRVTRPKTHPGDIWQHAQKGPSTARAALRLHQRKSTATA